jgi:hypothetical protein
MGIIDKLWEKLRFANALLNRYQLTTPAMEVVYRELFLRDIKKLGIEDSFYPVGAAANHGLLYLLVRCFTEFEIRNAIELGAGETSMLMSRLNSCCGDRISIRTVEHDAEWADYIRTRIRHDLAVAPLVQKTVDGHPINHYADGYFDRSMRYDFVLIDGPPAYKRSTMLNRLGAVEMIPGNLADDFVLIVDDAERRGEDLLIGKIRRALEAGRVDFSEIAIAASKRQHLFCAGRYARAAYF